MIERGESVYNDIAEHVRIALFDNSDMVTKQGIRDVIEKTDTYIASIKHIQEHLSPGARDSLLALMEYEFEVFDTPEEWCLDAERQ